MRIASIVCTALVFAAGCTTVPTRDRDGATDVGVSLDTAVADRVALPEDGPRDDRADTGTSIVDSGVDPGDSGTIDTGVSEDTGVPPDSGIRDTGVPTDTGVVTDTGVRTDTGVVTDTGVCPSGQMRCGALCVDTRTSREHCGACGTVCTAGTNQSASCVSGACMLSCNTGFADCDRIASNGCEASLSSIANCGRCGNGCAGTTPMCNASTGTCVSGCTAPAILCSGSCVDTATSVSHCGGCGRACSIPNASSRCVAGACQLDRCNAGYADCDGMLSNGCEVNITSNPSNCGACGTRCSLANATAVCTLSACTVATCNAGFGNCDSINANGCETDVVRSTSHCGRCGTNCGTNGACLPGTVMSTCVSCAQTSCGTFCANTNTDTANCGACGYRCPTSVGGSATCSIGRCYVGAACDPRLGDCDRNPVNGYETNTDTSNSNCGACGTVCGPSSRCCNGNCRLSTLNCIPCA